MNKKLFNLKFVLLIIFILGILYFIFRFTKNLESTNEVYLRKTTQEYFDENYSKNKSSDVFDKISIKMKQPEIRLNATTPEKSVDDVFCNIMYSLKIRNLTDKEMYITAKFFIPDELCNKLEFSSNYVSSITDRGIEIGPNKRLHIDAGILMKHINRLTEEEKLILEEYCNDLDAVIMIDGVKYFFKIVDLEVVDD